MSFSIAPATFTVLLGLNGAGKSTLFSLITRLYGDPARSYPHFRPRRRARARRSVAACSASCSSRARSISISRSTQNLIYHAALHGIGRREARERADEVLARIALADRANDKVRNLSGGQMRRVEIARALLHRPRLLLLDEPTVGLDIKSRADILGHVRQLVAEEGVGVLWATHLIDEVAAERRSSSCCIRAGFSPHGAVARVVADAGRAAISARRSRG